MRRSLASFSWRTRLGLVLALLAVFSEVLLTWNSLARKEQSHWWVRHTLEVQVQLEGVLSALKDVETGQRGYLLTEREEFLETYYTGVEALERKLSQVRTLTQDNRSQQRALDELEPRIHERLLQIEHALALARQGGRDEALPWVEAGQVTMGAIRERVARMQAEEERLLREREEDWRRASRISVLIRLTGSGLLLMLALLAASLTWRSYQSERRMAQRALGKSWDQLLAIIDNAPAVIYAKDGEGRYLFFNRRLESLLGVRREDALGHTDYDYFPKEVADAFRASDRAVLESNAPLEVEEVAPHEEGLHVYLSIKFPLTDVDGRTYAICSISTDITDRKQMAEYEQRLLGIVGHDLRSPLAAITASAQYLLRTGALSEPQARSVRRIVRSAERMHRLITRMMDYTRRRAGEALQVSLQRTCVGELAASVLDDFQFSHPEVQLVLELEGDTHGLFDPVRIEQLLLNLVENAVNHSPPGAAVRVACQARDGQVLLSVHNEGEPIPERLLAHLFEPFRRGEIRDETVRMSAGLGLYIVQGIVESHGGTIEVDSTEDRGTTFTILLPRRPAEGALSMGPPASPVGTQYSLSGQWLSAPGAPGGGARRESPAPAPRG